MSLDVRNVITLLQVFDMRRSVAFYRDVLEFKIVETSGPGTDYYWAMLALGPETIMLNTAYDEGERPSSPDRDRAVAHGDTILYFLCDDADGAYAHLRDRGWPAEEPFTTHYGMRQVYTHDPDGFGICFQQPVDASR